MLGIAVLVFLLLFAVTAFTVAVGWNHVEARKKKKASEMLQTAVGETSTVETKVLIDAPAEQNSVVSQFVGRFDFAKGLEAQIQQAGMTMSANTLLMLMIALTIPGALIGSALNPLLYPGLSAAAFALVCGLAPWLYMRRKRAKRLGAFEQQFPEALEFLSRAMRAGHAFSIALEMLSEESPQPLGSEFRKVFNETNLGLPIEAALLALSERVPLIDVRFFVSAVLLQRETGGNLAEILTKLAFVIRERFKLRGAVKAASAHGRITGTILTLLPVVLMFGLNVVAPSYLKGMAEDPDGRIIMAAAIVMVILGHFAIQKIVKIKV